MRSPVAALALVILSAASPVAAAEPPLRDQARAVLLEHCGTCHDGTLKTAKPKALAIFDLSKAATWSHGLDDQRLDKLSSRMVSFGTGDAARATIAAFVAAERAERVKRRGP